MNLVGSCPENCRPCVLWARASLAPHTAVCGARGPRRERCQWCAGTPGPECMPPRFLRCPGHSLSNSGVICASQGAPEEAGAHRRYARLFLYAYRRRSSRTPPALTGEPHGAPGSSASLGTRAPKWDAALRPSLADALSPEREESRSLCHRQLRACPLWLAPVHTRCFACCQACHRGDPPLRRPPWEGEGAGGAAQRERGQLEGALLRAHGG